MNLEGMMAQLSRYEQQHLDQAKQALKVTGGKHAACGVGETFLEALARASWRWMN